MEETKPQLSKSRADVADETEEAEASSTSVVKPSSELNMDSLAMDESKSVYKTLSNPDDASIGAVTSRDTSYKSAKRFEDLNLTPELLKGLYVEMKFGRPNKLQGISLPMILTPPNKNLIAQTHNGSGKTTCFVLGMLSRVDPKLAAPQALCICPTRERSIQTMEILLKMGKYTGITSELAIPADPANYIPINKRPPVAAQVIIGTPGTINKWVIAKKLGTSCMKILVFDEADHILAECGFQDDSVKIMKAIVRGKADCQVLLFSVTFNETVKGFVKKIVEDLFVKDSIQISPKKKELSRESVKRHKVQCPDELSKVMVIHDKILELAQKVTTIQGALKQEDREKIIKEFNEGLIQVNLVRTGRARRFDPKDMTEPRELYAHLLRGLKGRDVVEREKMGESSRAPPAAQDTRPSSTSTMVHVPVSLMRKAFGRCDVMKDDLKTIEAYMEIENRARLVVESQLRELKARYKDLKNKNAQLIALRAQDCKEYIEAINTMVSCYQDSKAFKEDVKTPPPDVRTLDISHGPQTDTSLDQIHTPDTMEGRVAGSPCET